MAPDVLFSDNVQIFMWMCSDYTQQPMTSTPTSSISQSTMPANEETDGSIHPKFNDPKCDLMIRSADKVGFRVFSHEMKTYR
jgi:hypothetical protein